MKILVYANLKERMKKKKKKKKEKKKKKKKKDFKFCTFRFTGHFQLTSQQWKSYKNIHSTHLKYLFKIHTQDTISSVFLLYDKNVSSTQQQQISSLDTSDNGEHPKTWS